MKTFSNETKQVLLTNLYAWIDDIEERMCLINNEFLQDKKSIESFIDDLKFDADLCKDDFPEHSKQYLQAIEELKEVL